MPWVLWDIVVPLLITFLVGLATGWLLWRWRRQLQRPATSQIVSQQATDQLDNGSVTILIGERDSALERAEQAEARVHQLVAEEQGRAGLENDIDTVFVSTDPSNEQSFVKADNDEATIVPADAVEETQAIQEQLEKEMASKAELEQAFMDLNNRYKNLNQQLEEAMDDKNAEVVRESATLQSQYDSSQQQLAEHQRKAAEQEQKWQAQLSRRDNEAREFNQRLADKESELLKLKTEKSEMENMLQSARVAQQSDTQSTESSPAARGGTVHHLSSYSPGRKNAESTSNAHESGKLNQSGSHGNAPIASNEVLPANGPARPSDRPGAGGLNAAQAVTPLDTIEDTPVTDAEAEVETTQNTEEMPDTVHSQVDSTEQSAQADSKSKNPAVNKSTASGYTPVGWTVPQITPKQSERDDLQEIKGIGPVLEKLLHKTGVYYFKQIALLDKKGVAELDEQLPQFSGRVLRDKWVQQAKSLYRAKYGEVAKN